MRLLVQLLFLSTINLLFRGIVWLIRVHLPLLLLTLRILLIPVGMSFTALAIGPEFYIGQLANEWSDALVNRGANPQNRSQLYSLCRFLVTSVLAIGWAFSAVFTLWLLRVVFGFFT